MSTDTKGARSRWAGLTVLTLPVVATSMDVTILHIAMPTIGRELTPGPGQTLWILDIYGFLLAGLLIVMGNVGDRIGRRRLLLYGSAVFGAASVLAAFATTPEVLIVARALMGVGGATLMPSTLSLIRSLFPDPAERSRAIGIWTASLSGGIAFGPVAGGLLLEVMWWGSVFLINVPVVVLLILVVPRLVPEYRDTGVARMSTLDVVLSFAAILPIVWAVKTVAEDLAVTVAPVLAAAAGLAAGAALLARQPRARMPLIDVRLFRSPPFVGAVLGAGLAMFALVGLMLYNAQYLQLVHDLSPLTAAVAMLPIMGAVGAASVTAPALAARSGYAPVFAGGAVVAATGMALFAVAASGGGLATVIASGAAIGGGIAPMMTLATDVVVASAAPERAGAAAALSETSSELGAAMGIAVLGSVGTAVYRSGVLDGLPDALPGELGDVVGSNLGAALAVSERVPDQLGGVVVELARGAFVDGLVVASWAGVGVLGAAAVACGLLLRGRRVR
ncbi:MFS transporter [Saccharomonospora sp. CUA-673]|uniref:MFS transporter n=1 Tax=Saccharomonospora sp. CUA-673 TaxID=1904969 RepID=UPI00095A8A50|nr:MFS transporter [Saccharomonospora sp. CUA-673]OLT49274.1 MFS transporter [Saccharomonospora sp. CUA-673]